MNAAELIREFIFDGNKVDVCSQETGEMVLSIIPIGWGQVDRERCEVCFMVRDELPAAVDWDGDGIVIVDWIQLDALLVECLQKYGECTVWPRPQTLTAPTIH